MSAQSYKRTALWALGIGVLIAAWDWLGQDLALAHWFGNSNGFPLRDHWLFSGILHQGARRVAWTLQLALLLSIWWPLGALRLLSRRECVHLLIATLASVLIVWLLKGHSTTSCPWDLAEFGGKAKYVSHWIWGTADGGSGECFPAGHASSAFSFIAGYFWLRAKAPRAARIWLGIVLVAGFAIGLGQQVRGAHYMSHTFWTAWLCWVVAALAHFLLEFRARRNMAGSGKS